MSTSTNEMESPYLEAIQNIAGKTPGEKYKVLNLIARNLIDTKNNQIKNSSEINDTDNLKSVMPIVNLEVAKILQKPDGIVDALKSDDAFVFDRALKVKWFFDGTHRHITNVNYYMNEIFSYISINKRIKIVKTLSKYLTLSNDPTIAEEFYDKLAIQYGTSLVEPLLIACREDFIWKTILKKKIVLKIRVVKMIFIKFPYLVIEYLKLSKLNWDTTNEDSSAKKKYHKIDISIYEQFLPYLLKNHASSFVEIIEMHNNPMDIELSHKQTELFLKTSIDALIRNPTVFISMLYLKMVTTKLTIQQFSQVFEKLHPKQLSEYSIDRLDEYLEYYSENDKLTLILSSYEKVYGNSLLENNDKISPELLRLLTVDERVKQAREKLKDDRDWHFDDFWNIENSWVCYLPIDESVSAIKHKISITSSGEERKMLLKQLIYTCRVNKDQNELLQVLNYILTRHRNECDFVIPEVLYQFFDDFNIYELSNEYFLLIEKYIHLLHTKNELSVKVETTIQLLAAGIYYRLKNGKEIKDYIDMFIENMGQYWHTWNILTDYPAYERKFLVDIFTRVPLVHKEPIDLELLSKLLSFMYEFNTRNSTAKIKLENLSVKNFEWMYEALQKFLTGEVEAINASELKSTIKYLKTGEKDLYIDLVVKKGKIIIDFEDTTVIIQLKKTPMRILESWEEYYEKCKENINCKVAQEFIRSTRWYQDIPILFVKRCLTELEDKDDKCIKILALLYEGSAFEKVITPLVPKTSILDPDGEEVKEDYEVSLSICLSLNLVNPPVSFDLVSKFCQGDYLKMAIYCLTNMARRVSIDKVIEFSKLLMSRGVSVEKHGIQLFCLVANLNERQTLLSDLWENKNHRSIRAVVFKNIYQLFLDAPSETTWSLMQNSIRGFKIDDDVWQQVSKFDKISSEFIEDYVKELLKTINTLYDTEIAEKTSSALKYLKQVLGNAIDCAALFSEELHQYILKTYFADLSKPENGLAKVVRYYVINAYILSAKNKLESRLDFLADILIAIVKKYWDVSEEKFLACFPGNSTICLLIHDVIQAPISPEKTRLVQVLLDILKKFIKPVQSRVPLLELTFSTIIDGYDNAEKVSNRIASVIPSLVETFTSKSIPKIITLFINQFNGIYEANKKCLDVVEKLIENEDENVVLFATLLLTESNFQFGGEQYLNIVDQLKKSQYEIVVSTVYDHVNYNVLQENKH